MRKLFRNIFPIICCLGFGFLISCSDKDPEPEPEQKLGLYLPVGSTMRNLNNEVEDSTQHTYDANGRLIQFTRSNGVSPGYPNNFVYDNNGRISKIIVPQARVIEEREYNAQGQLYKISKYRDLDPAFKSSELIFGYDATGKLIKINSVEFDNTFGSQPLFGLNKLTYNADGLIVIDSSFIVDASKSYYMRKTEFEYDNKKGVNEFGISLDYEILFGYLYLFAPLKHNITSIKETESSGLVREDRYQYEYNTNDYPTRISSLKSTRKITYQEF